LRCKVGIDDLRLIGNRRGPPAISAGLLDVSLNLGPLLLGRLDIVRIPRPGRRRLMVQIRKLLVGLGNLLRYLALSRNGGIQIKSTPSHQAKGHDAASQKVRVSLDPGHTST